MQFRMRGGHCAEFDKSKQHPSFPSQRPAWNQAALYCTSAVGASQLRAVLWASAGGVLVAAAALLSQRLRSSRAAAAAGVVLAYNVGMPAPSSKPVGVRAWAEAESLGAEGRP